MQSFVAEKFSYFGIGNFPSTVGRGQKIDFSKAKVRFLGEGSDLSDSVKSLVSTVEKTAGLPRSQDSLLPRNDMAKKAAFTLAEGATHIAQFPKPRCAAFTLAEVLITLGIIGVVAAMTLPALIQNYQKGVALNRLKQTYAQVQTAIDTVAARDFDGLPLHQWSCDGQTKFSGVRSWGDRAGDSCLYLAIQEIAVKMYPQPDSIEHAMCYEEGREYRPYTGLGGGTSEFRDGKRLSTAGISALLPNGACVRWHWAAWAGDAISTIVFDIDGPYSGYNQYGKDVFKYYYSTPNTGIGRGANGRLLQAHNQGARRSDLKNYCKKNQDWATSCEALILNDGWQMKSDYPW